MTTTGLPLMPSQPGADETLATRAAQTMELFRDARATRDAADLASKLDDIVVLNLPLADAIASRYRRRGIDDDDLAAVARLALVKAARRFEVDAGHEFASFAGPTIRGEIKRYFRDHGWMVRPPRRIQELQAAIASADRELSLKLGHSPRPSDLAAALDTDLSDIEEALAADGCFTPASLDLPVSPGSNVNIGDILAGDDASQGAAEARAMLGPPVRQLSERDRHIVKLRFFDGLTQSEIAADIGVTQMQVSRLLARILRRLRQSLDDGQAIPHQRWA